MKRSNKQGFTTVELVIVIAVIAILAAVLIPTFANLIKKANVSADTQLAKNLNTALAMDEATNGKPEEFTEVLDAMREAGYLLANMNPTTEGCYLAWEKETNQIVLFDLEKKEVLYSAKEGYGTPDDSWYFAVKNQEVAKTITDALGNTVNVEMTILNTTDLNNEINAGGDKTVYVDGSIEVDENNVIKLDNADANTTIDLGDSVISGGSNNSAIAAIPFEVEAGELTLKGGAIGATGAVVGADGSTVYNISINADAGTTLNLDGTKLEGSASEAVSTNGKTSIKDTTATIAGGFVVAVYGKSNTIVENSILTATSATYAPFWVSRHCNGSHDNEANLTVKSGTFNGYWAAIIHGGTMTIEGGDFTATRPAGGFFYVHTAASEIVISGGTFNGKAWNEYTEGEWEDMCFGAVDADATINPSTGVVTITFG